MPGISGEGGVSQIVCGPSDRIIEKGDMLFIDTGSTFDGYFCDFDRNFIITEKGVLHEHKTHLLNKYNNLLTIIIPRHVQRTDTIHYNAAEIC